MGDFETTVYKGQVNTEVWASAIVELGSEDVHIFHSIGETFDWLVEQDTNIVVYYHNLKFDGAFWLSYFMVELGLEQAIEGDKSDITTFQFQSVKDMPNKTFAYSISDMGLWYRIVVKWGRHTIEFRDSMKLLPFSVKRIGKAFKTSRQKLDMEYSGFRYAGCEITEEEQKYIANDVLVVKEALEGMFKEGHKKLTIGSCCLAEYRALIGKNAFDEYFPNLYAIPIDESYGCNSAGEYIRKSYHGGWCYVVPQKAKKIHTNGFTADVNSLYPSMMSSESGNPYPIGEPIFWQGNYIPDEATSNARYYFVRVKTRFYIKPNHLPFIQVKHSLLYKSTEALETSDVYNFDNCKYYSYYIDANGVKQEARITMTMTMTDFALMKEHYNLVDFEILDGCYFETSIGIFDLYIDKYKKLKMESTGALRELAKLFLNNLYGKMASSPESSFKVAYVKDDQSLGFYTVEQFDKVPGYIPVGSAITSYARNFTIRTAQKNYYGPDKPGFIYADTDSIHCDIPVEQVKGITIHPTNFCCWKIESSWDIGWFVRQKTYIEHVVQEDLQPIDKPYYNVKCAGMSQKCKDLFLLALMQGDAPEELKKAYPTDKLTDSEKEFISHQLTLQDFNIGLVVPGKLLPKRIMGGVLLVDVPYQMR